MGRTIRRPAALVRYGMLRGSASKAPAKPTQRLTRAELLARRPRPTMHSSTREEPMENVTPLAVADLGSDSDDDLGLLVPDVPNNDSSQRKEDGRDQELVQSIAGWMDEEVEGEEEVDGENDDEDRELDEAEEQRAATRVILELAEADAEAEDGPRWEGEEEESEGNEPNDDDRDNDIMMDFEEDILPEAMGDLVSPKFVGNHIDQFQLGLALFTDQASLSRIAYEALTELLSTVTDLEQLRSLPKTLDTLKKRFTQAVPIIPVSKKDVAVIPSKLPTLSEADRKKTEENKRPMYFIDPLRSIVRHFKRADFSRRNYIGVGQFVAHPKEMWESNAWCSSVRTSSGDLATYPESGDRIIPSDVIAFKCQQGRCFCQNSGNHIGRITAIGKQGKLRCVKIQMVATRESPLLSRLGPGGLGEGEAVLVEKRDIIIPERDVTGRINAFMDWSFGTTENDGMTEYPPQSSPQDCQLRVKQVVRPTADSRFEIVPLRCTKMLRAELEIRAFNGRESLLARLCPEDRQVVCLPFLMFIDGFGLYRTMYRSLVGIYIIMATLNHRERSKSEAMYTMAFGPHATNFSDIMDTLAPQLKDLDRGCDITVNGRNLRLFSYPIGFLGDMPQQNAGAGIQGPTGFVSCRWCLVDNKQRGNMEYDVVENKRWLLNQEAVRHKAENARNESQADKIRKPYGLSLQASPITAIWRSCDPTSDFLNDPCHSELAGMMKVAVNILFKDILTEKGSCELAKVISNFPTPRGWNRLQSPKSHLESYQIQEYGRLSIILPIILRMYLDRSWIELRMIDAITFFFCGKVEKLTPATEQALVKVFTDIARSNRLLLTWTEEGADAEATMRVVKQARLSVQLLEQSVVAGLRIPSTKGGTAQSSAILTGTATPKRKNKGKDRGEAVDRMRSRPNMHIGLHYGQMIEDYGCANNGNVLLGEDRHRKFKAMVTHTNHRNPEQTMLIRDSMHKTVTTLLNDSGTCSGSRMENDLSRKLRDLEIACPALMGKYRKREPTEPERRVSSRGLGRIGARVGLTSTKLTALDDRDMFLLQLMMAWGERMCFNVRKNPVVFFKKLTFYPRSHSKRISVEAGDVVDINNRKVLITTIFTHKLKDTEEMFVSAIPLIQRRVEEELKLPVLGREHGGFEIINADRITERPLYSLAVRRGLGRKLEPVNMKFPNEERDMGVRWDHEFLLAPAELEIM
ncbi:hypothetical protein AAP_03201 [Ascosphaera apis ARSEF 7405]|uniref:Uncharacterized protein n=1 Tax=Ascosphaera apis ARSEF 7405 TaxID=392613 RepID=A0A167Z089_9EURO|nr:hypothetical protein AAP_03201 [Ascosphaera apis ARSEF 7405]